MTENPPRIAARLFAWRVPAEDVEFVLGDLNERFEIKVKAVGVRKARRWYWRETMHAWATQWRAAAVEPGAAMQGDSPMQTFVQDFRFAIKSVRSRPGLNAAIILTLALAIGANSTIFSWAV